MLTILKILLLLISVQWIQISGDPLFQGISFQKGFEINLKPFKKEPFAFIREKWSPFGVFGRKFAIQKRSLDDMVPLPVRVPRPAAPVFEDIDEIDQIGTGPLFIIPAKPMVKPPIPPAPVPVVASKPPPPPPKPADISSPKPIPLPVPMPIIVNELPPLPVEHHHAVPPISTNMVIIQPPTKVINRGLYTDISRAESVKEHIDSIKPIPGPAIETPAKPPVPVEPVPPLVATPIPKPSVVPVPPPPSVSIVPPPPVKPVVAPPPPVVSIIPPGPPPPPPVPPKVPEPPVEVSKKEEKKEEPPPKVPPEDTKTVIIKENAFIRGSRMALQFGTVFLTLMAQFFDSARATIDQMTNPPPVFQN